ncbi:hypothetical protein BAU15_13790 [Enterococcus sp. JM4C]|uniref:hypothetical protein n=1 Tax=Candidatus Enterococcus huntleyi TaxID=1857217 RepID=UPI0013798E42|nr:hypothetical protein [Enterococcus sp. JM4C]KAF1298344.1 hypothetical protein BAU15_13790 [Enterococcus sp. JM4C]
MQTLESTKLTVVMMVPGVEKTEKQTIATIAPNPAEEQILALGDILVSFAPVATVCESVIKTEQVSYKKTEEAK